MKLTVHLVTWNGAKYIPYLFASLRTQTFTDWTLVVLDNSSTDNTVELIQKELINFPVLSKLIVNDENKGFAGGHNRVYARTNSEFFVLLNQDLYLEPDCLEKLMRTIEMDKTIAVVSPRLMKWDFNNKQFTNTIDSLGLRVWRSRRVVEIGAGEEWQDNVNNLREVFGVSGTLPLFRRAAVDAVAFSREAFFDESYGSYKEDVDLAFRLRSAGYKAYAVTDAVAHHDRTAAGPKELSDTAAAHNKIKQPSWVKYHSYKNHLMTLYKNEYWQNFILDFFWIVWYELKKFTWFLLFNRSVLKGLREIWRLRGGLQRQRQAIKQKRKMSWQGMRQWWN